MRSEEIHTSPEGRILYIAECHSCKNGPCRIENYELTNFYNCTLDGTKCKWEYLGMKQEEKREYYNIESVKDCSKKTDTMQTLKEKITMLMKIETSKLISMEKREEKGENMCGEGWEIMDNISGRIHAYDEVLDIIEEARK